MTKHAKTSLTHLQKFGLFFYDHIKTTASLWIALVIFGVLSYSVFMQRQGFPNVAVPISVTTGTYFVNDKSKVDSDVVKPLSELIKKQSDVKSVSANAGANFYNLVIEYKEGTDTNAAVGRIQDSVKRAGFIPANATVENKVINASKINNEYDVLLSVRNDANTDLQTLIDRASLVAAQINVANGVLRAEVLNPFKRGVDAQGKNISIQQNFDRYGERLATTTDTTSTEDQTVFYPSVEIGVIAKDGTDAIHLEKSINQKLVSINATNDTFVSSISSGIAEGIEDQISSLQQNLLEGLVVVIIISLLLISLRAGFAAALSMTSVLLITVGVLYVAGITLNTITLFALVLCLGLIVDDTTIMAEAIDAGKGGEGTNREIVARAIKKVARASTAGTLVTILAFSPMLFISGILGSFIKVLPITIIVSLAVSLLVSLTLIPFMSKWLLLSKRSKKSHSRNPVLKLESAVSSGLATLIRVGNRSRKKAAGIGIVAIALSFVLLAASTMYFQKLKFDIFPSTKDSDVLTISIAYPTGTTIAQAEAITDKANIVVGEQLGENLRDVTYLSTGTAQSATATIRLTSFKEREVTSQQLIKQTNDVFKAFKEARVKIGQADAGPPKDDLPFRVQIYGEDTAKTSKLANDITQYLNGREVTRQSNNTKAKIIRVEQSGSGDFIVRKDAKRLIEVQAGFDSDDTSALVSAAQKAVESEFTDQKIASYGLSKDSVAFDFGNESNNQDSFKSMLLAFPVLLLVMYILLAFQFGSLLQPLLIFTAIPFSFFGVAAGLHYTDNPLSFFVMIGFFALIGIAVNNTILLVDFANQERKEGYGGFESMARAVKGRFRPLLTTSFTSVVALIPLALSDPFWESLAFTLIFGLLSSTLLVIVSFPYYYLAAEFLRSRYSRRLTLLWIFIIVATIIILGKVKASLIPIALLVYVLAMLVAFVKGLYLKRLSRRA